MKSEKKKKKQTLTVPGTSWDVENCLSTTLVVDGQHGTSTVEGLEASSEVKHTSCVTQKPDSHVYMRKMNHVPTHRPAHEYLHQVYL